MKNIAHFYGIYFNLLALLSKKRAAVKAFQLFCTIRKGRVTVQQAAYLEAATYETLEIADHSIRTYQWPGEKETVLLVHGWESNSFRWRNLITRLTEANFNVIAFDAPAHGHSSGDYLYVPLYSAVLQHLIERYRPQMLVGHSVGGMTTLYNEYRYNNAFIDRMVTIGSPSEFYEIMAHYQSLLKFNDAVLSALDVYIFDRFGFHIRDFSTSEYVKSNTKKGLLFHDKQDKIAPYHASEKVHAHWNGSQFISTEGLGHSMHQEEVNDQIIDFLNSGEKSNFIGNECLAEMPDVSNSQTVKNS